jgi:kynurenine formamidase
MTTHHRAPHDIVPRRYGDDDQIGAANEITAEKVASAARLIRTGKRYALGQILDSSSPAQMWRYWAHSLLTDRTSPERAFGSNSQTFVEETISGALHSGTHLDGLGHVGIGEYAYGGRRWLDIIAADGLTELGIENVPPLASRGVLLDIAALHGVAQLDSEYGITSYDLEEAAQRAGVTVESGDILFIHTGWGSLWATNQELYGASEPGIDLSAARWCTDRIVTVIGSDNWAVEQVLREPVPGSESFAVHQETITRNGIYLLENARTAELAADGVSTFFCVIAPIRLRGGSGSMVGPVAIV